MKNVDIISRVVARKGETISSSSKGAQKNDFSDYLLKSIWEKVFEIRTDNQGSEYIFGKLPVVTQYGITMYSGDGVDIPSLASGLPFDGRTIWYNPDTNQIEVIGGTGGGSGEGVSNFWDLSGIPSWITISKPKYSYSEIEGTPDLSGFATQNWIISQGYASAEELKKYIPISGYTEVSGEKNFTGGLKVNGSPIYYDTEKKYWKLEGDLLVTGGVTMYGVDSTDIPSLINSLPVATTKEKGVAYFDPNFFSVSSDGKVSFIGETGGGLDIVSLQNYLTQNSYLNVTEGDNRYLKLSGGTMGGDITLPKNHGKSTTYSIDFFEGSHYYLFTEGGVLKYGVTPNVNTIIHSGNYSNYALPLSGGVVKGVTTINGNSKTSAPLEIETPGMNYSGYIKFTSSGTTNGYLGMGGIDKPVFRSSAAINYTLWHSGNDGAGSGLNADLLDGKHADSFMNFVVASSYVGASFGNEDLSKLAAGEGYIEFWDGSGGWFNGRWGKLIARNGFEGSLSGNATSATKLETARTIWGQSFDGTGNVDGLIRSTTTTGGIDVGLRADGKDYSLLFGVGTGNVNRGIFDITNKHWWIYRDSTTNTLIPQGNVGIGTEYPEEKLDVDGVIRARQSIFVESGNGVFVNSKKEGIYISGAGISWHGTGNEYLDSLIGFTRTYVTLYQNTTVQGNILATGGITTNDSVTINGIKLSKSKDGVLYLDGNLVVKGGVTMYGTDATSSPSILNSLPIASTTTKGIAYFDSEFFSVGSDGKVSFIGKTDGFNASELQNYLTQNSYLNTTSGDNRYLKLSGGTMSGDITLPKPNGNSTTYAIDFFESSHKYLFAEGGVLKYGVAPNANTIIHSGNYSNYALPLSGGVVKGVTTINGNSKTSAPLEIETPGMNYNGYIKFASSGTTSGYLGMGGIDKPVFRSSAAINYTLWHSGNDGADSGLDADLLDGKQPSDLNVGSATKLETARTIWGQSFRGTGDVMAKKNVGMMSSNSYYGLSILPQQSGDYYGCRTFLTYDGGKKMNAIEIAASYKNKGLSIGIATGLEYLYNTIPSDATYTDIVVINSSGLVGIGTNSPSYKLHVNGSMSANSLNINTASSDYILNIEGSGCVYASSSDAYWMANGSQYKIGFGIGSGNVNRGIYGMTEQKWLIRFDASNTCIDYGNVGIGTASPSHKLHVVGNTYLNGDVFADELNTFDVLPRTSATYDLGNSSYKWNNVYASSMIAGYIHGGGSALYLGNSDNSSYIYIREDMKASSESWSLTTSGTMSLSGDLTSGSYGSNCVAKFQGIGSGNGYYSVVELITNNEVSISYSNNSRYSDSRRWSVGRASSNSNYRFNFWNASYNGTVSYIDLNGNFWVAGGITMYSDRRKKTILRDVELSLKEVANAPLIEHYYNSDDKKTIHVGSIAQYWAGLNDWFCKLDNEGYYTMEVQNAALASAISVARELDRYETKTDKQIKKLKKRICELEEEVERLKSA